MERAPIFCETWELGTFEWTLPGKRSPPPPPHVPAATALIPPHPSVQRLECCPARLLPREFPKASYCWLSAFSFSSSEQGISKFS